MIEKLDKNPEENNPSSLYFFPRDLFTSNNYFIPIFFIYYKYMLIVIYS